MNKERLKERLNQIRDEKMREYRANKNVVESLSAKSVADVITEILVEINSGDFE